LNARQITKLGNKYLKSLAVHATLPRAESQPQDRSTSRRNRALLIRLSTA
jgi:hypothetical protein